MHLVPATQMYVSIFLVSAARFAQSMPLSPPPNERIEIVTINRFS